MSFKLRLKDLLHSTYGPNQNDGVQIPNNIAELG